jgi:hypothetical protein
MWTSKKGKKMGLIAKTNGITKFKLVPNGVHLSRCYSIVDLGTQADQFGLSHKIDIRFEVHGEDDEGKPLHTDSGEPLSINKNYRISLAEKANLRRDLESWRGKPFTKEEEMGFTVKSVLGVWAMISVIQEVSKKNGNLYASITTITPVPKQMKANLPEGHNDLRLFDLDEFRQEDFNKLSEYHKKIISLCPEYQKLNISDPVVKAGSFSDMADDIPF